MVGPARGWSYWSQAPHVTCPVDTARPSSVARVGADGSARRIRGTARCSLPRSQPACRQPSSAAGSRGTARRGGAATLCPLEAVSGEASSVSNDAASRGSSVESDQEIPACAQGLARRSRPALNCAPLPVQRVCRTQRHADSSLSDLSGAFAARHRCDSLACRDLLPLLGLWPCLDRQDRRS